MIRRFESCYPSHCDPLAQVVEHLTFNQGVRSSSLRWVTITLKTSGEVSEWFKELVLKTSDSERDRGFESHLLRLFLTLIIANNILLLGEVPKLAEGTPLERVQVVNSGARVQIPPSPFAQLD